MENMYFYDDHERHDEEMKRKLYEALEALKMSEEMCNVKLNEEKKNV